jgi:hypothetical protein
MVHSHSHSYKYSTNTCAAEADGDLKCEAGAGWEDINQALKDKGIPLFFPVSTRVFSVLMTIVTKVSSLIPDQEP